jgi:plastocyanin
MKRVFAFVLMSGVLSSVPAAFAIDITGTVTLKGTPPKEKEIAEFMSDSNCRKTHSTAPTTRFYLVGPQGQLADVVVSLQGISGKSTGASAPPFVLDQKGCEYTPYVFAVQTGQKVIVRNSDSWVHNVHGVPGEGSTNKERNEAQGPNGAELTYSFAQPEMFFKFKCEIHPWMFSYASIFDHPYFAVTAKDGTFKISNVPAGKYTLQAAHRKAGTATRDIEIKEGERAEVNLTLEVK